MAINVSCSEVTDELGLCGLMESLGVGLAVLFKYLLLFLPILLILFVVISAVGGIVWAIVYVIKKSITSGHKMR